MFSREEERLMEKYSIENDRWIKYVELGKGKAVKNACCRNELPERSMWKIKMGQ